MVRGNSSAVTKERMLRSIVSGAELAVLQALGGAGDTDGFGTDIAELATLSGISESEEVLRALYTLEGKCLAQPHPPGDLTSTRWKITELGMQTLAMFAQ